MKHYFTFLLLFFSLGLAAQEYVVTQQHWDVKDGLDHRQVYRTFQDKKGFIWVYTHQGLNQFDGNKFKWVDRRNDTQAHIFMWGQYDNIIDDSAGRIWQTIAINGVTIYDPPSGKKSFFKAKTYNLEKDKPGWHLDKISKNIIIPSASQNTYVYISGNEMVTHSIINVDSGTGYIGLTERNTCWLLKNQKILLEVDLSGKIIHSDSFSSSNVICLNYVRGVGAIFKQGIDGNFIYVDDNFTFKDITNQLPPYDKKYNDAIYCTGIPGIVWRQKKLWSLTSGLIYDLALSKEKLPETQFNEFRAVGNQIFISTNFGFYRITISRNKFNQYDFDSAQAYSGGNSYRGILVKDSLLYALNDMKGLRIFNIKNKAKIYTQKFDPFVIYDYFPIIKTNENKIKFARRNRIYEIETAGKAENFNDEHWDAINYALFEPEPGKFLIGTSIGLRWLDENHDKHYGYTQSGNYPELDKIQVEGIFKIHSGNLWIITNTGIYELDKNYNAIARYSSSDTGRNYIPAKVIHHFHEDGDGIFWIGTNQGLIKWDRKHNLYHLYTRMDGLSNDNIMAVYEDKYNRLWLSSDYGIMQFNKNNNNVVTYLTDDGITYNEFNRISHYQDASGNIYFGSLNGITSFNPDDFPASGEQDKSGASLALTSFMQFNGDLNKLEDKTADLVKTNKIVMNPDDRFVNIEFVLLNYTNTKYNNYYWKIDGIDTGWNIQKEGSIRLSRLPYGSRLLRIRAQEGNGSWSKNDLIYTIEVIKPLYLQTWFIISMIALLISGSFGIYKWRVSVLERENTRLDTIIREKTNDLTVSLGQKEILLKEIHHRVKNNLQVISSLLRLQSGSLDDPATKNILQECQNRVLTIALIHQKLYQNEEVSDVEIGLFSQELFLQLKMVFHTYSQNVTLKNQVNKILFNIDVAVPLALILNELITNSFKYAFTDVATPYVQLSIEQTGTSYTMVYFDNGNGLPPHINFENSKTLGLKLINRLSKQLKGKATYHYDGGSYFTINFKA